MNHINYLDNIHMVMVGTTLPANIGSAARAIHTMGLSKLYVVAPRLPIDETSHANAAGATDILNGAKIVQNLSDATCDCSLVLAASARTRHIPRPVITPNQAAKILKNFFINHHHTENIPKAAILFGREDRGLTNDELASADYHIQIPANPAYPVLNVASAMQVIAAYIHDEFYQSNTDDLSSKTHQITHNIRQDWDEPTITHTQKAALERAVIELMTRLDLADDKDLKNLPNRLSRLSSRAQLDQKEYALLRSLIAKINQKL